LCQRVWRGASAISGCGIGVRLGAEGADTDADPHPQFGQFRYDGGGAETDAKGVGTLGRLRLVVVGQQHGKRFAAETGAELALAGEDMARLIAEAGQAAITSAARWRSSPEMGTARPTLACSIGANPEVAGYSGSWEASIPDHVTPPFRTM